MRHLVSSILSSSLRLVAYQHHHLNRRGYTFFGNPTTVFDTPKQHGVRKITWLINMQKDSRFMSTLINPDLDSTIGYNNESNITDRERDAGTIGIEVTSRENIKPLSPTPQNLRHYKLSMLDQFETPIYNPFMFFYPNNNHKDNVENLIRDRSKQLKQSLSEALTRMYPFAGKLASELRIDCNDDGAYYVETRVDDRLHNVLKNFDHNFLKRLLPVIDHSVPIGSNYVTMIQVNFFKCGGVSISVLHSHKLADGRSTMAFINTWAAIARQDPNQVYPDFVASSMFPQNPQLPLTPYVPLWHLTICPAFIKHDKCENTRFVFDALALRELKAKASKHEPVSRVVAVLALLWKCLTIATQSKPSVLHVPLDIRHRLSPPLSESSIGNILMEAYARFDPDGSNVDVPSMANRIKKAIASITAESIEDLKGENGHVRYVQSTRNSMEMLSDYKVESYFATSMCNSGGTKVDFGWGKPAWSCVGFDLNDDVRLFRNSIMLMDSCCNKDGIEAWMRLDKQVMAAIKCNDELLSYASINPSPL